jgi:hypothetical protein
MTLCFIAVLTGACWAQNLPCSEARIRYSDPPAEFANKVRLTAAQTVDQTNEQKSPHSVRVVAQSKPNYMNPGPWSSSFTFLNQRSSKPLFSLVVKEHGSTIHGEWVSDRLYFVEIWWGRIAASEVLIDVETRKIIYHQFAHYGEVTFCEEK